MASKHRYVEIVPTGGGDFEMVENGNQTQTLVFDKTHDRIDGKKMKKDQSYKIEFTLDENGPYKFVDDEDDVMWVAKGDEKAPPACPTSSCGDPEFEVLSVSDYELKIRNKDSDKCMFKFVINMVDANGNTVRYDPIYDNRNGGLRIQ